MKQKPMKQEIFDNWMKYSDVTYTAKNIGTYRIELFYGTNRGGVIMCWKKGYEKLEHIWMPSDDKKYHLDFEANFMRHANALIEYKDLQNVSDVLDLGMRTT